MLATPPFGASSNKALLRANIKPPVELVVADLDSDIKCVFCKNIRILPKIVRELWAKVGFIDFLSVKKFI